MLRTINTENILDSKRSRKPKQSWEPEDPRLNKRSRKTEGNKSKQNGRNRNEAASSDDANRWNDYRQLIKRFVGGLLKEKHYLELYSQSQNLKEGDKELARIVAKVKTWKQAIISTMNAIESEYAEHKRWPELGQPDEEDMVEVAHILCSVCNQEETETNDILFCDRAKCFRAYHQLCLQPPITLQDFDASQDWFCWQCECLDDCLDLISERLGEEYTSVQDLFPEVQREKDAELAAANTLAGAVLGEDEDDDMEEEYNPTNEEITAEAEEFEDAGLPFNEEGSENNDEDEVEDIGMDEDDKDEDDNDDDGNEESSVKEASLLDRLRALPGAAAGEYDNCDDGEEEEAEELSEIDSDLDEEEVAGLLEDAADDLDHLPIFHHAPKTTASDDHDGNATIAEGYRGRLRDRSKRAAAQVIHIFGADDVGREVARVQRGVFVTGSVTDFTISSVSESTQPTVGKRESSTEREELSNNISVSKDGTNTSEDVTVRTESVGTSIETELPPVSAAPEQEQKQLRVYSDDEIEQYGRWSITYRDGLVQEEVTFSELRTALELGREYVQRQESLATAAKGASSLQGKISALVQSNGLLSAENMIEHKREKKGIDYIALSMEMFGTLYDDDDERILEGEDGDNSNRNISEATRRQDKPNNKKKRAREDDEENDEEEDEDPLGLKMAVERDEDYNSDDAGRKRAKKVKRTSKPDAENAHKARRRKVAKTEDDHNGSANPSDSAQKKKRGRPSLQSKVHQDTSETATTTTTTTVTTTDAIVASEVTQGEENNCEVSKSAIEQNVVDENGQEDTPSKKQTTLPSDAVRQTD